MSNLKTITDYIHDNYFNHADRLSKIKAVGSITMDYSITSESTIRSMIDKIALFNGIKKSYPPEVNK